MPPSSKSLSLNPLWPHHLAFGVLILAALMGFFRGLLMDTGDRQRCRSLTTEGRWLDREFRNWQPAGCMLHSYKSKDISTCLSRRNVVFIGDSVTRQLFFTTIHIADPNLSNRPPNNDEKHSDHEYTSQAAGTNIRFTFIWDPFLNTTRTRAILDGTSASESVKKPALLVLGSGLWYLRYADLSGGITAWEAMVYSTFEILSKRAREIADEVVFLPIEEIVREKLSTERAKSMHMADIDAMNTDLLHRLYGESSSKYSFLPDIVSSYGPSGESLIPISIPFAFNKMLSPNQTKDGLHFSETVLSVQANVLFNLRCNEVMPKVFPFAKTCCNRYPRPYFLQLVVLVFLVLSAPLAWAVTLRADYRPSSLPSNENIMALGSFGVGIGILFLADRTGFWLKEQKQFDAWAFGGLCVLSLALGLATVKKEDKDLGFMNREQTDEWKGWMQFAILIYHYYGASKISGIYNPIRVLVAAYLFMTGYGHTSFFLSKKADFGFKRIAQIMIRLNLLTVTLAYTMNTDYLFYYFAPLVSLWFTVIWVTLFVGAQYNGRVLFVLVKIGVSAAVMTALMKQTWVLETLFGFLAQVFAIRWSAREWNFRVTLDLWIVYFGMLSAILSMRIKELHLAEHPRWPLVRNISLVSSILALIWFFAFEVSQPDKFAYNAWHPFISFIPVIAFVILRNANATLRSASSQVFAWIGRCSLETFIIQYHFWLAGDTKGILIIIPATQYRSVNLVLSTVGFVYVSHRVAEATGTLTSWICGVEKRGGLPTAAPPPPTGNGAARQSAAGNGETVPLTLMVDGEEAHKPTEEQRVQEPDTPTRPRWIDRLADAESAGARSDSRAGGRWNWPAQSTVGGSITPLACGMRIGAGLVVMWMMNLAWPRS